MMQIILNLKQIQVTSMTVFHPFPKNRSEKNCIIFDHLHVKIGRGLGELSEIKGRSIVAPGCGRKSRPLNQLVYLYGSSKSRAGSIHTFFTFFKFMGWMVEMYGRILRVRPRTNPVVYFRRGVSAVYGEL